MVGRAAAVAALEAAQSRAAGGEARLVLVRGEAGIGKTRLARDVATRARVDGWLVRWGESVPLVAGELPYAPVVGALRDDLGTVLDDLAGPADAVRTRLFELVLGVVRGLAARAPLLLVLEDLHWADRDSEDFVRFLVRNLRDEPLLVVPTWRDGDPGVRRSLRALLSDLERSPRVERLELDPLDPEGTAELLCGITGEAPDAAHVAWVHARAEGNPFFIEELVAAGAGPGSGLPAELRRVLLARAADLPAGARAILELAAAAGRDLPHDLLAGAAGLDEPELAAALRALEAAHVLTGRGMAYAFRHALVREAVYEDLLPSDRVRCHRALAGALDRLIPPAGRGAEDWAALAGHKAAGGEPAAALEAALQAAAAAARVHACDVAHQHVLRARELWARVERADRPAGVDEAELLRRLAVSARLAGRPEDAIAAAEAAVAAVDAAAEPERAAELHHIAGRLHHVPERAVAHYDAALALLPPEPSELQATVLVSSIGAQHYGTLTSILASWARSALAVAEAAGARLAQARCHHELGIAGCYGGEVDDGIAHFRRAIAIAAEEGEADAEVRARGTFADSLLLLGRYEESLAESERALARARTTGLLWEHGAFDMMNAADAEIRLGRHDAARARVQAVLASTTAEDMRLLAHAYAVALAAREGRLDEGLAHERQVLERIAGNVPPATRVLAGAARAELALARGDPAAAWAIVEDLRRDVGRGDLLTWPALLQSGLRALVDLRAERDLVLEVIDEIHWFGFEDRTHADGPPEVMIHWEQANAEHARYDGVPMPDLWAMVAEQWDCLGTGHRAVYARMREGEARLATGDRAGAAAVLRRAAAEAAELGAAALAPAIDAVLQRTGVVRPFDLTARELTVLARLAEGATNRRIAEELVLSTRTVDMHVRNVLFKLGAANRGEAAAIAHRHGIATNGTAILP